MKNKKLTVKQIHAEIELLEKTKSEQQEKFQEIDLKLREQSCKIEKTIGANHCLNAYLKHTN